jgi:hypothetical protein
VPLSILGGVLALAERFVARRRDNVCAKSLRLLEVAIDIRNGHVHVLVNLARTRRAVLAALAPDHDRAVGNDKLSMTDNAIPFDAQALPESKGSAEPVDRFADIFIDQDRNDGCRWCGLIYDHFIQPSAGNLPRSIVLGVYKNDQQPELP